jgi:hypothetical protein
MAGFKSKKPRTGFSRPTASGGEVVDRQWRDVYPEDLQEGDLVAGMGVITFLIPATNCSDEIYVEAGLPESKDYFLPNDVKVKAFVRKDV